MKQYYLERNGLISENVTLDLEELRNVFYQTYHYFKKKKAFDLAFKGYDLQNWYNEVQSVPPTMAPSPEVFFMTHLKSKAVWPIEQYYEEYSEEVLFSVIEILYDHIGFYDSVKENDKTNETKEEFALFINNILKLYKDGYYLEPTNGYVMNLPNEALKRQLEYQGAEIPEDVFQKLQSASKNYYRFNADLESKKSAIVILAGILENVREDLKIVLNREYGIKKTEHDKLIFGIVNEYNIRHNRDDQKNDYSHEIWFDWMMQYYTSVIIAYYKLKKIHEDEQENPNSCM